MLDAESLQHEIAVLEKKLPATHEELVLALLLSFFSFYFLLRDLTTSAPQNPYFQSESLSLLLRWCRQVCHLQTSKSTAAGGLAVDNLTASLSDGRALCYIVSFYLPDLLPESEIRNYTSVNKVKPVQPQEKPEDFVVSTSEKSQLLYFSPGNRPGSRNESKTQRENEIRNIELLQKASVTLRMPIEGTFFSWCLDSFWCRGPHPSVFLCLLQPTQLDCPVPTPTRKS